MTPKQEIEPIVTGNNPEQLQQTAEFPAIRTESGAVLEEGDLELATLACKGRRVVLITPKLKYTVNLRLGDNGIEASFEEIRRVNGGYVHEVDLVRSEGYSIDSGCVED